VNHPALAYACAYSLRNSRFKTLPAPEGGNGWVLTSTLRDETILSFSRNHFETIAT
jgi:hypothetical protein